MFRSPPHLLRRVWCIVAFVLPIYPLAFAQTVVAPTTPPTPPPTANVSWWSLSELVDRLPQILADRLPGFDPNGAVRVYVQPHFNDFFHAGYVTMPVGARAKITDRIEVSAELRSYFAHGSSDAVGNGLSSMNLGVKSEHLLPAFTAGGFSVGLDFRTPLSRPPIAFTDGYRHVQPYISATRLIVPKWRLLGYASFGANFLSHTSLPSNFGRNQLHANTLAFTAGLAREWSRLHVSLTARVASTEFMSDEGRQNFGLRPEVAVPLRRNLAARTQIYLTLGGHVVWGPDGRESGTNTNLRVTFQLDRKRSAAP